MTAAAELFPRRHPKRTYNEFDRDTERELAACFKRYPREDPRPDEVPFYPYLPPHGCGSPIRVCFNLGYNPFAIN